MPPTTSATASGFEATPSDFITAKLQIAAVAFSFRIRIRMAAMRSLLSAAYMAAFSAMSALPSAASTSRIRSRSVSTSGFGFRHSLRVRPSADSMKYSTCRGSAFAVTTFSGSTTPASRGPVNTDIKSASSSRRIQVGLVQHQQDRFVTRRQLHERRIFDFIQVRIGDEQHKVGPFGRFVSHRRPPRTVDFIQPGRVDENHLRTVQTWHAVTGPFPADVPDILRPPAADIHARHRLAHERIDERRLAGADLAEYDDLDPPRRQLLGHRMQLIQIALQRSPLLRAAAAKLIDRAAHAHAAS